MTYAVILGFIGILGSLAAALVFMMRAGRSDSETPDDSDAQRGRSMAKALTVRIALSVALFALLLLAYALGWIQPTGLPRAG